MGKQTVYAPQRRDITHKYKIENRSVRSDEAFVEPKEKQL